MNSTRTIYLLDDDASARKGLTKLLTAAGYDVAAFASSEEFLQLRTIHTKACLIMDAGISGSSENDLQTLFLQKSVDLPVIFLSAGDDKESRVRAHLAKAVGFFRKPVDGPALLDAIAWALATHEKQTN